MKGGHGIHLIILFFFRLQQSIILVMQTNTKTQMFGILKISMEGSQMQLACSTFI
jgi:hypothetical protein